MSLEPFSLYIHIPYCLSKCPYCDFNSHVVAEVPEVAYVDALIDERQTYADTEPWRRRGVQSVFFGGGTPSIFKGESIRWLVHAVASAFPMQSDCEITLEANPGTLDRSNFASYRHAGVNRMSVGVQSFQPQLLKFLGRIHSAGDACETLRTLRDLGFANFSFDLIYANPGQSLQDLEADLDQALAFDPPHLSAYNLTFEEGTPLYREYRDGKIVSLDEEQEIAMAELIETKLASAGLERYEISNYARPGFQSRHNTNYWRSGDYLGIGAGAHSYTQRTSDSPFGTRWSNEKNPARYMQRIQSTRDAVADREQIDRSRAAGEFMLMGLRMLDGICCAAFRARFGRDPVDFFSRLPDFLDGNLLERHSGRLRLTRAGLLVANAIFVEFMV